MKHFSNEITNVISECTKFITKWYSVNTDELVFKLSRYGKVNAQLGTYIDNGKEYGYEIFTINGYDDFFQVSWNIDDNTIVKKLCAYTPEGKESGDFELKHLTDEDIKLFEYKLAEGKLFSVDDVVKFIEHRFGKGSAIVSEEEFGDFLDEDDNKTDRKYYNIYFEVLGYAEIIGVGYGEHSSIIVLPGEVL